MAQEILIVERSEKLSPTTGKAVGFTVRGLFLYPLDPPLETIGPKGPKRIVPQLSAELPAAWTDQLRLDLLKTGELAAIDSGAAVFVIFDEGLTLSQSDDPGGEGREFLRELYVRRDPRPALRYRYRFTGARVDAV